MKKKKNNPTNKMLNAEFLTRAQKTLHLQKQAGMILAMHGLTRSAHTHQEEF